MALTPAQAKELLASPELAAVEEAIAARTRQPVIRDQDVTNQLVGIQNDLYFTPLTSDEVIRRLRDNAGMIVDFGVAFLGDSEATKDVEEYPPGEEPGPGDLPVTVQRLGLNSGFGIKYLVYIYFLEERTREDFLEVLKKRRTPGAAKFVRDLRNLFKKVRAGPAGT